MRKQTRIWCVFRMMTGITRRRPSASIISQGRVRKGVHEEAVPPGSLHDFFADCVTVPACGSESVRTGFVCISLSFCQTEKIILTAGVTEWAALRVRHATQGIVTRCSVCPLVFYSSCRICDLGCQGARCVVCILCTVHITLLQVNGAVLNLSERCSSNFVDQADAKYST